MRWRTTETRYYHRDHLGSTRTVVDQSGTVLETYDYMPFGEFMDGRFRINGTGARSTFTGHAFDSESALYTMHWRRYNPRYGQFRTPDPMADSYPGINPYAYVLNDPMRLVDPDGREVRCSSEAQCARLVSDMQELYGNAPVSYEQRTQTKRTWFGFGPEETTEYYAITVDEKSDFNWAQDKYASALYDAIVSEDIVFNVHYQKTAEVANNPNADLQGAGGGIYEIVSSREANIYVDPRGYERVGDPPSIILMHEMIGHNHPVATPSPGRLNNAHDINRFYHQKLGIQPRVGYRNPHRGYKGEIQWPRTGYFRR